MLTDRIALRQRLDKATDHLETPVAAVDLVAFDGNAAELTRRAAGKPIRVASKSVRCRALLERVLARPGWRGVMSYTLPEAIWLVRAGVTDDVLVAYPTADRTALRELAADPSLAASIAIMVDHPSQLDLIDQTSAPGSRSPIRLCIDVDASWKPAGPLHVGVRRSPVHSAAQAGTLARKIAARQGFKLVGVMSYEAHIAGVGDDPPGRALRARAIRLMQKTALPELLSRRGAAVDAIRQHADLEFVNGGGTGSVAATSADPSVTEVTAGSGLYGPTLFDSYRNWKPAPAAFFALSVVRRPAPRIATVLGGGWIASGPPEASRLPTPYLPEGLKFKSDEGAGEVQTPLLGTVADGLRPGDRVWFRHAKAGELCERVNHVQLIDGDTATPAPTYRGEGHAFLG
ncbi:D-serine deaminase-like pyridoxal phosphate-dependent protein [Actinoplanes lutulentus]|uniref:D-serine deaminase-like pyridoxal phosphate-dependent protein n=1 Tax=Actinoplanes lutulentus TaxID=1287878 RepID=A0A327Z5L2_9ACTN|nr:amino acid deaminase/aldolase [Actinoplanes lutulentus]MBB2945090.1 D-serine deaminase-like pyridoxal phosphate-dependent protein [Actinoplanes lutulentus]RAK31886.1 D-serine deaminase-like pyridoxal phosphate-dependent protein [Actinoplanes lutulentus]